jgi:CHAT domain-containing protein
LPVHAAGIYSGTDQVSVADYVVSSYAPSLSSVIRARDGFQPIPRGDLAALLVAEPKAPGLPRLASVQDEVQAIDKLLRAASTHITHVAVPSSVERVLDAVPSVNILHLACHGLQSGNALRSHFALGDGHLTIAELMKLNLPKATLAFLSACETAKADLKQPDQAVHLAASMLFCGFRSVIATMWQVPSRPAATDITDIACDSRTMSDLDGPEITQSVYEALLQKEVFDLEDIPYALDAAVRKLRDSGVPPHRWATFIHMGA